MGGRRIVRAVTHIGNLDFGPRNVALCRSDGVPPLQLAPSYSQWHTRITHIVQTRAIAALREVGRSVAVGGRARRTMTGPAPC